MEVRATAKYIRVQPRKVRIIADEVRGQSALKSAALLRYHPSKSAKLLHKVLESAIANAAENHRLAAEDLTISTIMIDEGPRLKRMRARAMGRGNRITKKTSHITVGVEEQDREARVRPHGTKAKPRPTFSTQPKGKRASTAASQPASPQTEPTEDLSLPTTDENLVEQPAALSESEANGTNEQVETGEAAAAAPVEPEAAIEGESTEEGQS